MIMNRSNVKTGKDTGARYGKEGGGDVLVRATQVVTYAEPLVPHSEITLNVANKWIMKA